ncbi:PPR domain-containing protein/PPR_2 domain-containing protein/DYW_deaminase domain-containing protein [Cephalotus follicularis]|uniref:PPR domain-containing protein/PPR_2 domain-containing protein/DYW_deaminase domain-containing protein n=1 Tax=Cephalotus follicularis TaxID=3775 RepID=A0A1Q3ALS2_CEPFO|nr:PPR domain-containing protein/PPR_2 domain-containing protein/DYW_deaminase domain-containing protein [Cephalotus follicularis]
MLTLAPSSSIFFQYLTTFGTFSKILSKQHPLLLYKHYTHSNSDSLVSALIAAISSCSSLTFCRVIHARVIKSLNYNQGFIGDQLVSAYLKMGNYEETHKLFDEMPNKDLVSWNSLISGFSRRGDVAKCINILYRMRFQIGMQPNEVTLISIVSACTNMGALDEAKYVHVISLKVGLLSEVKVTNSLINLYGKFRYLDLACLLFEALPFQNRVSWNSIIAIQIQNGFADEGMRYFTLMRRNGIGPDQANMVPVLQACEDIGLAKLAEAIHVLILKSGLNGNVTIATSLLKLYAKLGRLDVSRKAFAEILRPDDVAWTAMLAGYASHGQGREAIKLFELMVKDGTKPDHVTFTHLLSACSHSGLVKEGKKYFRVMAEIYGVEPRLSHYSCMVDLLSRSGLLDDAYQLIKCMPMEPNSGVWGALLGACRVYGNTGLAKVVAEQLFALEPSDSRNFIMLSNIYSAAGLWKEASSIRALMKHRGLRRNPGCSFIEHGNKIHRFVVGDESHPESEKIYTKLKELMGKIREAGMLSKTEFVLHNVDEDVKEDMVNKHSEKLAIAYGLLVTNPGMPFIVTKNLRTCGDCHSTAKLVSLIEKRTIIIRDSKRFHHFANGLCSCGDYW